MPATSHDVVASLGGFARAALWNQGPEQPAPGSLVRRRAVCAATTVLGAATLYWSLHLPPGDPVFYLATAVLALVWMAGGRASGPVPAGRGWGEGGPLSGRAMVQSAVLGLVLLGVFLAGAVLVSQVEVLEAPVQQLLDHARQGSLPVVALVTAINGLTEEYFFRGALFAAFPPRWRIVGTTLVYCLVTAMSGVPLLVLAAGMLGVVVALQRRVTSGFLAPTLTHLVWSLGMLFLLPPTLDAASRLLG